MKKNRILAVLCLAMLMAVLTVTACRGGDDQPDVPVATPTPAPATPEPEQPGTDDEADEPDFVLPAIMNPIGTLPIVNEPVTFSVFAGIPPGGDNYLNLSALWFEERTGINFEWVQVPNADREARLNLMLATGDVPDVITGDVGPHARVYFYAQQGLFRPITNYIDPFAPEMQNLFAVHPNVHDDMIMPDGEIYAFTAVDDCFHCSMFQKMWIYTPWLDEVGLPMPATTDEFFEVMVAFRDLNPDIVPFMGAQGSHNTIDVLITPFIPNNGGNRLLVNDGVIIPAFSQPEWREAMMFLNRMYTEGLLATESFVQDRAGLRVLLDNPDDNIVGVFPALWLGNVMTVTVAEQEDRWNSFRMVPPLSSPVSDATAVYFPFFGNNRAAITTNLPEEMMPIAVRWLDNFYTIESALIQVQGIEDLTWRFSDPGEVGIHGGPALWERVVPPEGTTNVSMGAGFPNFRTSDFRLSERANRSIVEQETLLYDMSMIQLPFRQPLEQVLPVLIFDESQSLEIVDLSLAINSFVAESIARFAVGDMCPDNDWDWYIQQLEIMDLARYIRLHQQAFDERVARLANR